MLTHTHTHIPLYSWQAIIDYVNDKYDQYLRDESGLNRRNIEDHRVHCCLYFINPSGHGSVYNSPSLVVCVIFIFSLPLSLLSPPLSLSLPSSPTLSLSPFLPPPSLSFQAEASWYWVHEAASSSGQHRSSHWQGRHTHCLRAKEVQDQGK